MTTRYTPTRDNCKVKQLKWINFLVHAHDINCDCSSPLECTTLLIFNKEKELKFTATETKFLQKCLGGEQDTIGATGTDPEDYGDGVLEALFNEDFGEENDTG